MTTPSPMTDLHETDRLVEGLRTAAMLKQDCNACDGNGIKESGRLCGCAATSEPGKVFVYDEATRELMTAASDALAEKEGEAVAWRVVLKNGWAGKALYDNEEQALAVADGFDGATVQPLGPLTAMGGKAEPVVPTPDGKAVEAWNVDWINDWMGRHDVHLPNPAYAELKRALTASPVQARTGEVTADMVETALSRIDFAAEARALKHACAASAYPSADGDADIDNNALAQIEITLRDVAERAAIRALSSNESNKQ
jgi:hypothetical protein